ncbi:hypothetical protein LUZ60_008011 [Juncus effusus]|nr:hypothetical protein LUZ60_008011 [Juncus effusus]
MDGLPLWFILLFSLGLLSILKHIKALFQWLHVVFYRREKTLTDYGSWALVTGATDGIGKAIAFELADKGLNIVLLGRNQNKLQQVRNTILSKHNSTKVKTILLDLAGDMSINMSLLKSGIEGLDLGILVNNAGTTYPGAMYFHEVDEAVWAPIIRVNVEATSWVTTVVVKKMVERGRGGAVVNIGSGSSVVVPAFPLYAVYAASKAFVDKFSRCLNVEYKSMGIDMQCQIPLYVATKMISTTKSSFFVASPEKYAEYAVQRIGYDSRCTPYWPHAIEWFFASFFPDFLLNYMRLQVGIRKRNQLMMKVSSGKLLE